MTNFPMYLGWWVCCQCGREVNPELWGSTCADCGHEQCECCEDPYYDDEVSNRSGLKMHQSTFQAVKTGGDEITETSVDKETSGIGISDLLTETGAPGRSATTTKTSQNETQLEISLSPFQRLSRTSSLTSIAESIFSIASGSSKSSVRRIDGASEQFAWLLIEDGYLQPLWKEASTSLPLDRLQRNLARLLKIFAAELKEEAVTIQEHRLAQFVRVEAKRSASLICQEIHTNEQPLEFNQKALEDSGSEGDDDEALLDFKHLEKFILNSKGFETFRMNLLQFVRPETQSQHKNVDTDQELWSVLPFAEVQPGDAVLEISMKPGGSSGILRSIIKMRNQFSRRPPKGKKRITWTCSCGHSLYDDYEELEKGAAKRFERILRRQCPRRRFEDAPASTRTRFILTNPYPFVASTLSDLCKNLYEKYKAGNSELPTFEPPQQVEPPSTTADESLQTESLFLLLCLSDRRMVSTMRAYQPLVHNVDSDKGLFRLLKAYYSTAKRWWWSCLSFWDLQRIQFVHFEMYDKALVDIRALDVIPPEELNTAYCYDRSPLKPPIGSNLLMHFFNHPKDASDITPCFQKIPKKRQNKLSVCPVKGISPGWGLYFHEGWNWRKILTGSCLVFVLAGVVVSVLYWRFEHNIQDAMTLGTFIIACFGIGMSTFQVWLIVK